MEVTTVSPSPASPTEGDDLCELDVTKVATHIMTLLISLCGLVGNGALLRLLSLKVSNAGTFDLAFADFLLLLFAVPSTIVFLMEDVSCSPIVSLLYLRLLSELAMLSFFWALIQLIFRSNTVYTDKLYKLCCRCHLPKRLSWLVYSVQYWIFFALFTVIPAVTNQCPSHQQWHCQVALMSTYALILLLCAAPILISTTINLIKTRRGSKKQQRRRRDSVMIFMVLFILLIGFCKILLQLGYNIVSSDVFFLLNCIHSSIKPFIYFWAGGFQRPCSLGSLQLSLQRVFDEQNEETARSNDALMDTGV